VFFLQQSKIFVFFAMIAPRFAIIAARNGDTAQSA
jgi:hypothetical protein